MDSTQQTGNVKQEEKPMLPRCQFCKLMCLDRDHLIQHLQNHRRKEHPCSECGTVFKIVSKLNEHMRIHTGERPFKCSHCEKTFAQLQVFRRHVKMHDETYSCDQCGKCYDPQWLAKHKLIHTGEMPYSCNVCGKKFRFLSALKHHQHSIHSQEKPYKCFHCEKTFTHAQVLSQHQAAHSDERPFKCDQCDKGFKFQSNLAAHKVTHYKHKVFACEICGRVYHSPSGYWNHKRTHKKQVNQDSQESGTQE